MAKKKKNNNSNNIASQSLNGYNNVNTNTSMTSAEQALENLQPKKKKESKFTKKFKEKLDMYDMIIANLIAGKSIINPTVRLNSSQVHIGFSDIASQTSLSKYFVITQFPDYIPERLPDIIRARCVNSGVKINFFFYSEPYKIDWNSAEMRNRMSIWKNFSEQEDNESVFNYRTSRSDIQAKQRVIQSTRYLNESELDNKRKLMRTLFVIQVIGNRDDTSLLNMADSIKQLKSYCNSEDIKVRELSIDMINWARALNPFCIRTSKDVNRKLPRKILTDDLMSIMHSYKQGRVGETGVPLGIDVSNNSLVLNKFKEDPEGPDNWLISAATGGGKSFFIKVLLSYLIQEFTIVIMDYEGDEYTKLGNYYAGSNPEDVITVSMGKGSTEYFDPCEIAELTGDMEVDEDLKESAVNFIAAIFRIIVAGTDGEMNTWEEGVLSSAIQRMYDTAGVTDDMSTWKYSKGLRLSDVYTEIKEMVERKELVDSDADNVKHKAALNILNAAKIYFEPGESKYGTFLHPMSANELYKARLIIFSFGMKGATDSLSDKTLLALRQLSVAYINIQISNYCKYVKHKFNVKVWEEFQRWGTAKGSAEVIINTITGGRKRGDVNFILTNDLSSMLDDDNKLTTTLRQNIQNYAIGRIKDNKTREEFCNKFDLQLILPALNKIAKASSKNKNKKTRAGITKNRYKNAFCIALENGNKATVKASIPQALIDTGIFTSGVVVNKK